MGFDELLARMGRRHAKKRLADESGVPESTVASYAKPKGKSSRTPGADNADRLRWAVLRLGYGTSIDKHTRPGVELKIVSVPELDPRELIIQNTPKHWFGYEAEAGEFWGDGKRFGSRFEHSNVPAEILRWPQFIAAGASADSVAIQPGGAIGAWSYRVVKFFPHARKRKLDGEFVLFRYQGKWHLGRQQGFFPREGGNRVIMAFPPWPWPDEVLCGPGDFFEQFEVRLHEIEAVRSGNLVHAF